MENLKCKLCNYTFTTKYSLERHLNSKRKCNLKTEFKCEKCYKCFKQKNNLVEHTRNKICNKTLYNSEDIIIINDIDIENIIKSDTKNKPFLLKTLGVKMTDEEIMEIINSPIILSTKISCFKNNITKIINTANINHNSNNTTNNITNNILINNFGNENISYLTTEYFTKLLNNNYGKDSFLKLSNEIYLNTKQPHNNTIKIDNLNNKYCKIIENNKWITTTKDTAMKNIFNKIADVLINFMDEVKDSVPEKRLNIINEYLEKDFEEDYIKETIKEFILNIYNFTIDE
jgi:hypothetical protein